MSETTKGYVRKYIKKDGTVSTYNYIRQNSGAKVKPGPKPGLKCKTRLRNIIGQLTDNDCEILLDMANEMLGKDESAPVVSEDNTDEASE